jgi:hypothetical protein
MLNRRALFASAALLCIADTRFPARAQTTPTTTIGPEPVVGYQNFWQAVNAGRLTNLLWDRVMGGVASWVGGKMIEALFPDRTVELWLQEIGQKIDVIIRQNESIIRTLELALYKIDRAFDEGQVRLMTNTMQAHLSYFSTLLPQITRDRSLTVEEITQLINIQRDAYTLGFTALGYGAQAYMPALVGFYLSIQAADILGPQRPEWYEQAETACKNFKSEFEKLLDYRNPSGVNTSILMHQQQMRAIAAYINSVPSRYIAAFLVIDGSGGKRYKAIPGIMNRIVSSPGAEAAHEMFTLLQPPPDREKIVYSTRFSGDWAGASSGYHLYPLPNYEGLGGFPGYNPRFTTHDADAHGIVSAHANALNQLCVTYDKYFEGAVLATSARTAITKALAAADNAQKQFAKIRQTGRRG